MKFGFGFEVDALYLLESRISLLEDVKPARVA